MNAPIDWLLEGEPWVEYQTRRDLLGQSEDEPQVAAARARMLDDAAVQGLIVELSGWPGTVIASHKSAGQPFHKLTFLAELGVKAADPGMDAIISRILAHPSDEGLPQLPMNIPAQYGGTGNEAWAWALCDAPLILYALVRFGLDGEPAVRNGLDHLTGLVRDNGWPCAVSPKLGNFRGPGRKDDPCPFANLAMLKALAADTMRRDSHATRAGAETLLALWDASRTQHPYQFYMGDDFRKLKVPLVWYDLLHVLAVLAHFEWLHEDPRFRDMLALLRDKADGDGRFTPESVWTAWKGWEFAQKKEPSRWLTFLAWRVIRTASPI